MIQSGDALLLDEDELVKGAARYALVLILEVDAARRCHISFVDANYHAVLVVQPVIAFTAPVDLSKSSLSEKCPG